MKRVKAALEHKAKALRRQRLTHVLVHAVVVAVALETECTSSIELVLEVKFADVLPREEGVVVVADVPVDEEAIIQPATREE